MMPGSDTIVDEVEKRTAELTEARALLTQSYDETVDALGSALGLKDTETEGHSQRVTAYTISIAKAVPVPQDYLGVLARAAFLHDIGKMAIPDSILFKLARLPTRRSKSCASTAKSATTC